MHASPAVETKQAPKFEIVPNDNERVREVNGRIYVSNRRTWDVLRDGECLHGGFTTKREALACVKVRS